MFRPNREFHAGLNSERSRRERQSESLSLRRKGREQKLQNKRKKILNKHKSIHNNKQYQLLQQLPRFVEGCFTSNKAVIFECTQNIRKLLSFDGYVPIKEVIESGIIPRILQFLRWNDCPHLQFESMWILTNIASSDKAEYTAKIIRDGSIKIFIDLLCSPSYSLQEQSVWTLGNIGGESVELRDLILKQNVLTNILKICKANYNQKYYANYNQKYYTNYNHDFDGKKQFLSLLDNVSWTLSNLCRGGIASINKYHLNQILQCLSCLIEKYNQCKSKSLGENIGWSLFFLMNGMNWNCKDIEVLNIMNRNGMIKQLIKMLYDEGINKLILKLFGDIVTGNDIHSQCLIDNGLLKCLYYLLNRYYPKTPEFDGKLKEICWVLSNITAGNKQHIISVAKQNLFPILIKILKTSRYSAAKEAMWALANATDFVDVGIINYLVQNGLISAMCQFFKNNIGNNEYYKSLDQTLTASLELIENILSADGDDNKLKIEFEANGGVAFLEYLQSDDNVSQNVYDRAGDIVKRYFDGAIDDDFDFTNNDNIDINSRRDDQYENQFGFGLNHNLKHNTFQF